MEEEFLFGCSVCKGIQEVFESVSYFDCVEVYTGQTECDDRLGDGILGGRVGAAGEKGRVQIEERHKIKEHKCLRVLWL